MRIFSASIGTLGLAALVGFLSPAQAADGTLTDQMAAMNYLTGGSWSCSTNMPAMGNQPAHVAQSTLTFDVVGGNVMHDHVSSPVYSGDDYFGYDTQGSKYWSTSADSMGSIGSATSPNGKAFTGTTSFGPTVMNIVSTYTKVDNNNIKSNSVMTAGGNTVTVDGTCKR